MIAGKISECQGPVGLLSPSYPGPGRRSGMVGKSLLPSPANTPTPLLPAYQVSLTDDHPYLSAHKPQAHANAQEKRLPAGRWLEQIGPGAQNGSA